MWRQVINTLDVDFRGTSLPQALLPEDLWMNAYGMFARRKNQQNVCCQYGNICWYICCMVHFEIFNL